MAIENSKKSKETDDPNNKRGRLSEETINYFKRVEQVLLENTFDDDEHKEMFLKNVFNQIEKDGSQLTRHTLTSKVLEKIIPLLNANQYEKLILLFQPDIELLSCDRFSSHVLETLFKNVKCFLTNSDIIKTFCSFCKVLRKHCSAFLRDVYGSHVLSILLQALGGVEVPELITKSRTSRESKKKATTKFFTPPSSNQVTTTVVTDVPNEFYKSFKRFSKVIQNDDNFGELLCHRSASPVLQVLLYVSSKVCPKQFQSISQVIIDRMRVYTNYNADVEEEDEETIHKLPVVLTDEVGSHLFEAVIKTADDNVFDSLAEKCFKRFIISLCIHPVANYLAQTFMRNLKTSEQAAPFVDKIMKFTEDVLATGHMGCIVRNAEVIARLEMVEKQKKFLNAMGEALHIPSNGGLRKPLVKLILSMMTYDMFFKSSEEESENKEQKDEIVENKELTKSSINYHGSCLLKSCFSFKKSKLIVESFLDLSEHELVEVALHPSGSFAFENFFQSKVIPEKKKTELANKISESFFILACDKFGSRIIDSIWKEVETENTKHLLQSKLRQHKSKLESDLYGRIILYNCEVKQQVEKMREVQSKQEKKRKLFEDILQTKEVTSTAPPVKKEKKPKDDDRAKKYRDQLKLLGITFDDEEKDN